MPAKSAATEMTYTSVRDSVRDSSWATRITYFAPAQPSRGLNPPARSAST